MARSALLVAFAIAACGPAPEGLRSRCDAEARPPSSEAGELLSEEGTFRVRFDEAAPVSSGGIDHTWTLEILDPDGAPRSDVSDVRVRVWMPEHGHGSDPLWNRTTATPDGKYRAGPFEISMSGLWEFTVRVEAKLEVDTAKAELCLSSP